jgi:hypothetical protein
VALALSVPWSRNDDGVGEYPVVSLAESRERQVPAYKLLATGINPMAERKAEFEAKQKEAEARKREAERNNVKQKTQLNTGRERTRDESATQTTPDCKIPRSDPPELSFAFQRSSAGSR